MKITETKLIAIKMLGLNWLWPQNIGTKIAFLFKKKVESSTIHCEKALYPSHFYLAWLVCDSNGEAIAPKFKLYW